MVSFTDVFSTSVAHNNPSMLRFYFPISKITEINERIASCKIRKSLTWIEALNYIKPKILRSIERKNEYTKKCIDQVIQEQNTNDQQENENGNENEQELTNANIYIIPPKLDDEPCSYCDNKCANFTGWLTKKSPNDMGEYIITGYCDNIECVKKMTIELNNTPYWFSTNFFSTSLLFSEYSVLPKDGVELLSRHRLKEDHGIALSTCDFKMGGHKSEVIREAMHDEKYDIVEKKSHTYSCAINETITKDLIILWTVILPNCPAMEEDENGNLKFVGKDSNIPTSFPNCSQCFARIDNEYGAYCDRCNSSDYSDD